MLLWVLLSFLLLFVAIAILIQIPAIQTKIINYATTYISDKTDTKVEIKRIGILFPKSIQIGGLYLEDTEKDTLLYAGTVAVNIAFGDLLNHKIHITSLAMEDIVLNMSRIETDSAFNFNFLITAFSDSTKPKKIEPKKESKWTFAVDNVKMKNIRVHFNDNYGGTLIAANVSYLKIKIKEFGLSPFNFVIDDVLLQNSSSSVVIKEDMSEEKPESDNEALTISVNNLQVNNTSFTFADSVSKLSLNTNIDHVKVAAALVDLQKELVKIDYVLLSKSNVNLSRYDTVISYTTDLKNSSTEGKSNWKVSAKNIEFVDNQVAIHVLNKPVKKNTFDADHLDYKHVSLVASNCYYSAAKTKGTIEKLSAVDQNNFSIKEFQTEFFMDNHSISANNVKAKTTYSLIDADLKIEFSSLKGLKDSMPFVIVNATLNKVSIRSSDIIYFVPELRKQSFFKNMTNMTRVSGIINGQLNNLNIVDLFIKTGINTTLKTDGYIVGLPDVKTAYFNFPNLNITSGRMDIAMIADTLIPKSIELPENIRMLIAFKGQMTDFATTLDLKSTYGAMQVAASIDKNENFTADVTIIDFDLGSLLKNKEMFGPVSLTTETKGHGLNKDSIHASLKVEISQVYLNKYNYHNLLIDGNINGLEFDGKINLNDKYATFDFDGLVNLNPDQEQYKFKFNVQGANLQKLNLVKEDIRIALMASADMKGGTKKGINGKAGITSLTIIHEGKAYILDSLLFASINEQGKSTLDFSSAIIAIKYNGTLSPFDLPKDLSNFINNYFVFSDANPSKKKGELQDFNFDIQLHNHPILSEVFLPQLKEFEPGLIHGSFDSQKNLLTLNADIRRIVYEKNEINDFGLEINSDANALNYKISCSSVSNTQVKLENLLIDGKLSDNILFASVSSVDDKENKKLQLHSQITKQGANYRLTLDPKDFYLMNELWNVATDNYIEYGKQGILIHNLFINNGESQVNIASVHDQFNDDLNIEIKKFELSNISRIVEKDSGLVKGIVDGNMLFKKINNTHGIVADATISNLFVYQVPIGNLALKAENAGSEKFNLDVDLSGADNKLTATGYFIPNGADNSVNIKVDIQSLSMKTAEAFSMGNISQTSGTLSGNFLMEGKLSSPDITGELTFNNVFVNPAVLNNRIQLKHETILLKKDGVYFNSFTVLDTNLHTIVINGAVQMNHFKDYNASLTINTSDFLLFNTTEKDNKEFYGRMIIDSKIDINGPITLPVIIAKIKIKKGSNFTFAVPEEKLTTEKGEEVVEFNNPIEINSILSTKNEKKIEKTKFGFTGFDISSIIEIDKEASLRLLLDPSSSDSLVVKGEAAFSFAIDRSGKMSLTGAYNINEGSYLVSLEHVLKKTFTIQPGGTIVWNGDLLGAEVSIDAFYSVRASPIDLVANQMSDMSETSINEYKQRYPFLVLLKLRGEMLHPEISFEIQLPPEEKGILGGTVNAKLNMLNQDPSALNKQVFALLILGRFIQENPLQSETFGASLVARTTVGRFLSEQLNQLSSKLLTGVELNFDIQSYDDYETGVAKGRTQVDISVKKQLFKDRFSVQVGGVLDVEGEKAKQNSVSDILSDVTAEFKLTKDGRYRLKGFRHNKYEGVIEGKLVEMGGGVVYVRDFNTLKELFKSPKKTSDSTKINSNDSINSK